VGFVFLVPLSAYVYKERIDLRQKANLKWVILMLLIVALARPVIEHRPTLEEMPVGSVVVAIDLSYSMRAKDTPIQPISAITPQSRC